MRTLAHILFSLFFIASPALAQGDLGAIALHQAVLDMRTDLRLMCVAAHPDDEDGASLAYYRMHEGIKTFTVVATRGEGGQNEIGPELYSDLAVIRTREMMSASEVTDAELHFLNLPEFGFSKSAEEAFAVWGREETVKRLVRVIREVRPDVIITNHDTTHGHGQHQAVGIALIEAFSDAANPDKFPEQLLEGLEPWQPKRLFVRVWDGALGTVTNDIYAFDPWRGKTYAEIAADALRRHRSQGMQFFIDRYVDGTVTAAYELVEGSPLPALNGASEHYSLFSGVEDRIIRDDTFFSEAAEPKSIRARLPLYAAELAVGPGASPETLRRHRRANDAAVKAVELRLDAKPSDAEVVPGQTIAVRISLRDFGVQTATQAQLSIKPAPWFPVETQAPVTLHFKDGKAESVELSVRIAPEAAPTLPAAEHLFLPHFLEPQLTVVASVISPPANLTMKLPLRIEVAAPVSIRFAEENYLARTSVDAPLELILENHATGPVDSVVKLTAPPALHLSVVELKESFRHEGERKVVPIEATWAKDAAPGNYDVTATDENGRRLASTRIGRVDVTVPENVHIGVVQSYDDTLVNVLERLGILHEALEEKDFAPERLDAFTTIVVDIRAYLVRPDLAANNAALLEYVRRGGNVVVMYQKTFEWKSEYAPYPLEISTNRVTREDAPVTLLQPEHPLFNTPNRIVPADWDGWIQERGLYFAGKWDPQYTPLIRTVDPGEDIPDGSLLVAPYGDGTYIYTALVWYRQLRALNPGALRLFANLLAQ